ncbi:MAG: UMP kinase [bacterium]|nr:UMP kinase [bacterium]
MPSARYQRVLLKLSGETLSGENGQSFDFGRIRTLAHQLGTLRSHDVEIALVLGGGNIFRGREARNVGVDRIRGDRLGMLATVMNASSLAAVLEAEGIPVRMFTATPMPAFAETWSPENARAAMAAGEFVIAAGGIGQPHFSTDTTAALRAIEIKADVLLKATTVDGVFSADPRVDSAAEFLPRLSYDEVLRRHLKIMDATAFALCRDFSLPMRIFNFSEPDILNRILSGEELGSLVFQEEPND